MKNKWFAFILLCALCACTKNTPPPPAPCGPLPSAVQLKWHQMEMYAFIHFSINTFTDQEWGYGDKEPALFNPTEMNCRQWARLCRDASMKGIVITAKHHDGFCLWPSAFTDYSVKNSPWKQGKGDVVGELAAACRDEGLKLGIYLSPWDRHHAEYGTPEYLTYYRNQLRELLTNYGEIFEVWFDGANGGDGYYGGTRETRRINNRTYYDWPTTHGMVRKMQPEAAIFSDSGPDCRWVGNEQGWAGETNWCTLNMNDFYPGCGATTLLSYGQEDGDCWVPAEVDVSIRPGWFYHESTDTSVKTPEQLMQIYYTSVGRNANLILNLPIDKRGLVHENDARSLTEFGSLLRKEFATEVTQEKQAVATNTRGGAQAYAAFHVLSDDTSYWATDDSVTVATLTVDLENPVSVSKMMLQEYIPLGQRIQSFTVDGLSDGVWRPLCSGTTIGYKRMLRFAPVTVSQVRLNILQAKACPIIQRFAVYE